MTGKVPAFTCENCGSPVPAEGSRCPRCGSRFSGVRCPSCGHQGREEEFLRGCPACGYLAGGVGKEGASRPQPVRRKRELPGWFYTVSLFVLLGVLGLFLVLLLGRIV